jgi:hypothetical protein
MTYRGITGLIAKLEAGDAVGGHGQRRRHASLHPRVAKHAPVDH